MYVNLRPYSCIPLYTKWLQTFLIRALKTLIADMQFSNHLEQHFKAIALEHD